VDKRDEIMAASVRAPGDHRLQTGSGKTTQLPKIALAMWAR
jgi:hypothetical protein